MSEGPKKPQEVVWSGESDREIQAEQIKDEFAEAEPMVADTADGPVDETEPVDWSPPPETDDEAPVDWTPSSEAAPEPATQMAPQAPPTDASPAEKPPVDDDPSLPSPK